MEEVVHTSPTLGSNVEEVVWKNIHFIMWDLGGQDSLRQGWQAYYSNTEVCFVFRFCDHHHNHSNSLWSSYSL